MLKLGRKPNAENFREKLWRDRCISASSLVRHSPRLLWSATEQPPSHYPLAGQLWGQEQHFWSEIDAFPACNGSSIARGELWKNYTVTVFGGHWWLACLRPLRPLICLYNICWVFMMLLSKAVFELTLCSPYKPPLASRSEHKVEICLIFSAAGALAVVKV